MTMAEIAAKRAAKKLPDYPFIRAWGRLMGSMAYYVNEQVKRAKETNAPHDAIYEEHPRNGQWARFTDIRSELTKDTIARFVLDQAK